MSRPTCPTVLARERFLSFAFVTDGCWPWRGAGDGRGRYGRFTMKGRGMQASRAAYLLFVGPLRKSQEVDHTCRNPRCVRPSHLEAVSHIENMARTRARMCKSGRHLMVGANVLRMGAKKGRSCRACRNERRRDRRSKGWNA